MPGNRLTPQRLESETLQNKLSVEQNKSDVKPFKSDGTKQIKL